MGEMTTEQRRERRDAEEVAVNESASANPRLRAWLEKPGATLPMCEHCWMEWADRDAPEGSGLSFVCARCATELEEHERVAESWARGEDAAS